MNLRSIVFALLPLHLVGGTCLAQNDGTKPDPFRRSYSFDPDFQLCIRLPFEEERTALALDEQSMANLGLFGTLGLVTLGNTDFASLTDAGDFFDCVDGGETVVLNLIRGRAVEGEKEVHPLARLLATRAVLAKRFKPALGVLRVTAKEAGLDPFLRRAVEEAIATLSDQPLVAKQRPLPPIAETLARIPDSAQTIAVVEHHKLPSAAPFFAVGADAAEAVFRQALGNLVGESPEMAARAIRYSATSRVLGYLVAQRFGNFQIHRTVVAARFRETLAEQPYFQFHCIGHFDPDAIAKGVEWAGLEAERDGEAVVFRALDGHVVRVDRTSLTLWHSEFEPTTAARHPTFEPSLEQLGTGAALAMWFDASTPFPTEMGVFRPARAALWMPTSEDPVVRAATTWANHAGAQSVAGITGGLGRLVEKMIDGRDDLSDLAELASELKVQRDGDRVLFTLPIPDLDLPDLLRRATMWAVESRL